MGSAVLGKAVVATGIVALAALSGVAIRAGMTVGSDLGFRTTSGQRFSGDLALRLSAPTVLPPVANYVVRGRSLHSRG